MVDYSVYHASAELLLNDEALYQGTVGLVYLYPPLLAQLLVPVVSLLSFDIASLLWFAVSTLSLVLSVYMVSRYAPASRRAWFWLLPLTLPPLILVYLLILCNMEHYPGKRKLFWLPALSILIWLAYYLYRYGYDTDGNSQSCPFHSDFSTCCFCGRCAYGLCLPADAPKEHPHLNLSCRRITLLYVMYVEEVRPPHAQRAINGNSRRSAGESRRFRFLCDPD
jgi:hypothetical protein